MDSDRAEIIAINSLSFIASEEKQLANYLKLSGLDLITLKDNMANPVKMHETLAGVLDFLMSNEHLLLELAESYSIDPTEIGRARQHFPGAPME